MSDEETQIFVAAKKRKTRRHWTIGTISVLLGTVFAGIICLPVIMDGAKSFVGVVDAPKRIDSLDTKVSQMSKELQGEEWRVYRVEQALNIRDDPPRMRQENEEPQSQKEHETPVVALIAPTNSLDMP